MRAVAAAALALAAAVVFAAPVLPPRLPSPACLLSAPWHCDPPPCDRAPDEQPRCGQ